MRDSARHFEGDRAAEIRVEHTTEQTVWILSRNRFNDAGSCFFTTMPLGPFDPAILDREY